MKLSNYFKRKNEIVVLAPDFSPERYKKFYYRKDYDDGNYPSNLHKILNCDYGGLAFSNNNYIQLPEEIEVCKPDTHIYDRMYKKIMGTMSPNRKKIWENMINGEHCRLSLDGKTVWKDLEKQFKYLAIARNLMLHDYDLGKVKNSYETVKDLLARARTDGWATRIGMKFPIQIYDGQNLLNWTSLKPNSTFYSLRYNGVIEEEIFNKFVGKVKEHSIYTQIDYYPAAASSSSNDFVINELPKIFKQVIISRSYHVFFTLKYEEDFFFDKRWERVIDLFNYYHNSYRGKPIPKYLKIIPDDTLFDFAKAMPEVPRYDKKLMNKQEVRELFLFVQEKNPLLFDMFYNCNFKSLGGYL